MVLWTIVISLAQPLDRAMFFFRIIIAIFSALTIMSMVGIGMTLVNTGYFPNEQIQKDGHWVIQENTPHFSYITFAGTVMMCVFILPMILRPIDFLNNF